MITTDTRSRAAASPVPPPWTPNRLGVIARFLLDRLPNAQVVLLAIILRSERWPHHMSQPSPYTAASDSVNERMRCGGRAAQHLLG